MAQSAPLPPPLSDSELIAQTTSGHATAFEQLVRRHNQRLFRAARAVTRSDADAEDALQQAWLEIYRNLSKFRGDATFTTWATRIVINASCSQVRRSAHLVAMEPSDSEPDHDAPAPQGLAGAERAQLGVLLERCLARIPQGNREVMVLRDVLELDTAETAACLGLSEEAVRVRLHRARAAVAEELSEVVGEHVRELYGFAGARCERVTAFVMRNVLATSAL